jgi:hypothetical protein
MDSVRSEDPINLQRQTARGAGIRDYGHSSAPVGPTLTMAGSPRTGRVRRMGPKLPHTLGEQLLAGGALHSGNTFWKN